MKIPSRARFIAEAKSHILFAALLVFCSLAKAADDPSPEDPALPVCETLLSLPTPAQIAETTLSQWSIPAHSLAADLVRASIQGHLVTQFHDRFRMAGFLTEEGGLCNSVCLGAVATLAAGPLRGLEPDPEKHIHETFTAVRDISKVENYDARLGSNLPMAEAYLQRQIAAGRLPRSLKLRRTEKVTDAASLSPAPGDLQLQTIGILNEDLKVVNHHAILILAVNPSKQQILVFDPGSPAPTVLHYIQEEDHIELYHVHRHGFPFAEVRWAGLRLQRTMWSVF